MVVTAAASAECVEEVEGRVKGTTRRRAVLWNPIKGPLIVALLRDTAHTTTTTILYSLAMRPPRV